VRRKEPHFERNVLRVHLTETSLVLLGPVTLITPPASKQLSITHCPPARQKLLTLPSLVPMNSQFRTSPSSPWTQVLTPLARNRQLATRSRLAQKRETYAPFGPGVPALR